MDCFRFRGSWVSAGALSLALALALAVPQMAQASSENPASKMFKNKWNPSSASQDDGAPAQANWASAGSGGKAVTETRIVNDGSVSPFLMADGEAALKAAEQRYADIVAQGGWGTVPSGRLKAGSQGKAVAALNRRLFIEGYLREEATQGQFAEIYTSATEAAVSDYQTNHGLAVSGSLDAATVKELNIPAQARLATIRANLPRVAEYSKNLGSRYVIVNVPAQQIEAVNDGRVYSIHNAIVGRPSRPTPVVETALATVKFNPYWNAPPSIVERDLIPRMLSSRPSSVMKQMNMKVFDGVGGPEINPDTINWRRAVVDNYQFRQEPGGENAMKTAKIEFNSPFGIYLHDTAEPQLFGTNQRFYSSGCVRVDRVAILINWILNGQDGIDNARIAELADTKERLDVTIANPPQLRVAYLTAWPARNGTVAFRPDVYEMDGTGFIVGQPMPVGEGGQRFVLKPIPRTPSAVDADEAFGFFNFGFFRPRNDDKNTGANTTASARNPLNLKPRNGKLTSDTQTASNWSSVKPNAAGKPPVKTASTAKKKSIFASAGAKKPVKKVVKKTTTTTKTATATASPGNQAKKAKPATTSTTSGQCKAGKDGKLPAGCKAPASAQAKPVVKPVPTNSTAAN